MNQQSPLNTNKLEQGILSDTGVLRDTERKRHKIIALSTKSKNIKIYFTFGGFEVIIEYRDANQFSTNKNMQPKNKDRTSFVELFVCITIFIMLICLMLPVLQTAVKEKLRIREETKKLNLEILESKAKVWKAIENDPKLLTPNMIRVLDK